jgi:hypothetical protein
MAAQVCPEPHFVGFGVYRIFLGVLLLAFFRHAVPVGP